ncbi:MAG: sulfatase family protein [Pirellulales bacterium]
MKHFSLGIIIAALFLLGSISSASAKTRPNFVVIFIDDMGYGDIGPFGSKINETPNLDRMAKEGRKLTTFYVASSVCTPSRAALMTGSYPKRVGLAKGSGHIVLFPGDVHGLNPNEITIAEMLKQAGYATGCFGKWHLGDAKEFLPTNQGFDEYYGIPYSNDMWTGLKRWKFPPLPILRNEEVVAQVNTMEEQADLCRQFTEEAISFIKRNKEKPFFAYIPHAFVHNPRQARESFMNNAENATEAQIEEVDWSVGQILQTLRDEGLDQNTFVLFTSDNGGAGGCVNLPLRGRKGTYYEGGYREPTIAWWPGTIPAGTESDEIMTTMDMMPTLAQLAGGKVPIDRILDGHNVIDLLLAKPGAVTPYDRFFYHAADQLKAVRSGTWKLIQERKENVLYHLENDIAETKNLIKDHPEIEKRLLSYMEAFKKDIANNSRPVGITSNPRTLLPRDGVEGEAAYTPTLLIKK